MEPLHPLHDISPMEQSIWAFILTLSILGIVERWLLGHFDKFIAVALKYFPLWHWGG